MSDLEDGTYDAIVVDAEDIEGGVSVELTITSGTHKGDMVAIRSTTLTVDSISLLGLPATLTVTNGEPHLAIED